MPAPHCPFLRTQSEMGQRGAQSADLDSNSTLSRSAVASTMPLRTARACNEQAATRVPAAQRRVAARKLVGPMFGHLGPDELVGWIRRLIRHPLAFSRVGAALLKIVQFATSNLKPELGRLFRRKANQATTLLKNRPRGVKQPPRHLLELDQFAVCVSTEGAFERSVVMMIGCGRLDASKLRRPAALAAGRPVSFHLVDTTGFGLRHGNLP